MNKPMIEKVQTLNQLPVT